MIRIEVWCKNDGNDNSFEIYGGHPIVDTQPLCNELCRINAVAIAELLRQVLPEGTLRVLINALIIDGISAEVDDE